MSASHAHDPPDEGSPLLDELARRIRAHAGLTVPRWVMAARLNDRVTALGLAHATDYLKVCDQHELDALTECLRVGETRFFRHQAHVGALGRVVIPDLLARRAESHRVRAWSAGCASGEEAYTLAMLLAEAMPAEAGWDLRVLATDLSEEALAAARRATYPEAALAQVPQRLRARWFAPAGAHRVCVVPALTALVQIERANLVEGGFPRQQDVILCRNVLIYFDPERRAATVERLIDSLAPGGFLFVGYAESLRAFANLEVQETPDGLVYRKPLAPSRPKPAPASALTPTPTATPALRKRRRTSKVHTTVPPEILTVSLAGAHESTAAVAAQLRRAISAASAGVIVDLDGAELLPDEAAAVFKRAAAAARTAGISFALRATRPGPRRWLARHSLEEL